MKFYDRRLYNSARNFLGIYFLKKGTVNMKSLSEITDFYYTDLHPILKELEKRRENVKSRILMVFSIVLLIDFMVFSYLKDNLDWLVFVNIAILGFAYKFLKQDYAKEFKDRVIGPLVDAISKNLNYSKDVHISEFKFINSQLFSVVPDKIEGNDHISGDIDGVRIELSDIHAQKKHLNPKGSEGWSTIFQGLFIICEFNKKFSARTLVLPDIAQSSFGNLVGSWLQSHNSSRGELIKMDNPEFEKKFVVYGSDQIEARYILTHSLMKRLLEFRKKSSKNILVSFVYSHIYIAIDYGRDLFEPSVFKSLLDYKVAMDYVQTLYLAIGIVEELKLNEKLWSKI